MRERRGEVWGFDRWSGFVYTPICHIDVNGIWSLIHLTPFLVYKGLKYESMKAYNATGLHTVGEQIIKTTATKTNPPTIPALPYKLILNQ